MRNRINDIVNWLLQFPVIAEANCPFRFAFNTKSFFSCSFCIKYFHAKYFIHYDSYHIQIICPCFTIGYDKTKKLAQEWIKENKK